jgi:hypothetical protein
VAVLFCDEERIAPEHQIPTDRGVAGGVGFAIPDRKASERSSPALVNYPRVPYGVTRCVEEEVGVFDTSRALEALALP